MRNLSSVKISEDIHRTYFAEAKNHKLVNEALLDISNMIMSEDKVVIKKLKSGFELDCYMNVEIYHALADQRLDIAERRDHEHRANDCPVCEEIHRIEFIIDCLLDRWKRKGVYDEYSAAVRFRNGAMEPGKVIN